MAFVTPNGEHLNVTKEGKTCFILRPTQYILYTVILSRTCGT